MTIRLCTVLNSIRFTNTMQTMFAITLCWQLLHLHGVMLRQFAAVCCGELLTAACHALRAALAGARLDIATLNTTLAGVFTRKGLI